MSRRQVARKPAAGGLVLTSGLNTPGILTIETFATERTAVFTFNPEMITRDRIRAIMETPVPVRDGTTIQVFRCLSVR